MKILRAYKTELDPNNRQRTALMRHAGAARFAYNLRKMAASSAVTACGAYVRPGLPGDGRGSRNRTSDRTLS